MQAHTYHQRTPKGANRFTKRRWHSLVLPGLANIENLAKQVNDAAIKHNQALAKHLEHLNSRPQEEDKKWNDTEALLKGSVNTFFQDFHRLTVEYHKAVKTIHTQADSLQKHCKVPMSTFPDYWKFRAYRDESIFSSETKSIQLAGV